MRDGRTILHEIGRTRLVALGRIGKGLPVPVLAKCEHLNPDGSVKDRIALAIVDDADRPGALRAGMTLIHATAANTGVGRQGACTESRATCRSRGQPVLEHD